MSTPSRLLRPSLARSAFRGLARPAPRQQQRRCLHELPKLDHDDLFKTEGIKDFLSDKAYDTAWLRYQGMMLSNLNYLVGGDSLLEHLDKRATVVATARDPTAAPHFNFASMAYNNHFFFQQLSPESDVECPQNLSDELMATFGSWDTLRSEFLDVADVMFGPGFVWLVHQRLRDNKDVWRVLPTYLAGTPLADAHWRQQGLDLNTESAGSVGGLAGPSFDYRQSQATAGKFGQHSEQAMKDKLRAPGGADVTPVLCVNTWQHVWLTDYGVEGKEEYLQKWWKKIDWHKVAALRPPRT